MLDAHRKQQAIYGNDSSDESLVDRWMKLKDVEKLALETNDAAGDHHLRRPLKGTPRAEEAIGENKQVESHEFAMQLICDQNASQKRELAKLVPRQLTTDLEERRVEVCCDLLAAFEVNEDARFSLLVIMDGTWPNIYEPETRHQTLIRIVSHLFSKV